MAFPKLASHHHPLKLPVAGRMVTYRGFTVREENALLLAKKVGTAKAHNEAIAQIVKTVTEGKVDPVRDAVIDVLYTFLMSRARAVGEVSVVTIRCDACGNEDVTATVDLSKIEVQVPDRPTSIFTIGDSEEGELKVELRDLSFDQFALAQDADEPDLTIFKSCVKRMFGEESSIDVESATIEDWRDLYYSMESERLRQIETFFSAKPSAKAHAIGKCSCGKTLDRELVRISDFL
jgi:hypothetical protein